MIPRDRTASPGPGTAVAAAGAALVIALLSAGCGPREGTSGPAEVSGMLVLAHGQLLPAGMPIELELAEAGPPKAGAVPLATATVEWGDGPETAFTLPYDGARAARGARYVLRARAALQGIVYFTGEALAPVPPVEPAIATDLVLRKPENAPLLYLDVNVMRLDRKRPEDWSRDLRQLMPAIQVCLRSVSGEGITVTRASAAGGGRIGVRIRTRDGSGFDCTALPDGSKFESLSGLPSFAAKLPGEGEPAFVPAPGSPQMDKCKRYERVLGGLDETLGWLVYDTCPPAAPGGVTPGP
jgi:uncharacterized lipoprotein YbaY